VVFIKIQDFCFLSHLVGLSIVCDAQKEFAVFLFLSMLLF